MRDRTLKWYSAVGIVLAIAAIPAGLYLYFHFSQRLDADPDTIVDAIYSGEGRFRYTTEAELVAAVKALGDVNGYSTKHDCSFVYAAAISHRRKLLTWLLDNGADANPKGPNPLLACIDRGDLVRAKQLLRAGARWDREAQAGKSVLQRAMEINPQLVQKLSESVPASEWNTFRTRAWEGTVPAR